MTAQLSRLRQVTLRIIFGFAQWLLRGTSHLRGTGLRYCRQPAAKDKEDAEARELEAELQQVMRQQDQAMAAKEAKEAKMKEEAEAEALGGGVVSTSAELRQLSKALDATRPKMSEAWRLELERSKSSGAQAKAVAKTKAQAKAKAKAKAKNEGKIKAKSKAEAQAEAQAAKIKTLTSEVKFLKRSLKQLSDDEKARKIRWLRATLNRQIHLTQKARAEVVYLRCTNV